MFGQKLVSTEKDRTSWQGVSQHVTEISPLQWAFMPFYAHLCPSAPCCPEKDQKAVTAQTAKGPSVLRDRPVLCKSAAAAAAKSLESCPTLCDPIDASPLGSSVPGILQARTLEWVAISFSNA